MKVAIAQTRPITADISRNIRQHTRLIDQAASSEAEIIVFPELSLTGYEPTMAHTLAVDPDDKRLDIFQQMSDTHRLIIGAGIPTRHGDGICISMAVFQPGKSRQLYSKKYLHADEEPFFVSGDHGPGRIGEGIALAICYEISVPEHAEDAFANGAKVYIASVAKFMHGIDKALTRLADIANAYSMTVLMANSVGQADGYECAGKSSIWNNKGGLLGQLDDCREGMLLIDTETNQVEEFYYP
jgi:predicted amidohydrolase